MKINRRTYLVTTHRCTQVDANGSSLLFVVRNRTFRDRRTHGHTTREHNTVQRFWNDVKIPTFENVTQNLALI